MNQEHDAFFKFEHESWQRVAAKYEEAWGSLTRPFIPPLLEAAHVGTGALVLDVACGPGFATEDAKKLGAEPVGVDFSAAMVQLARERNPGLEYFEGDAQKLRFEDHRFDAVVMNFGVLHLSDPEAAFAEACRVLRSGGRYGFTVWAGSEKSPGAKIVADAIEAFADTNGDVPEGPDSLRFSDRDRCRKALTHAGFDPATFRFETVSAEWVVPSPTFIFESELRAGVRTGAVLASQKPEVQQQIRAHIEKSVLAFASQDGYAIPFAAHIVAMSKP